jgi:glycosyltransferase involved in cell wall biosynthesis
MPDPTDRPAPTGTVVSVVIPTYNNSTALARCLASLAVQTRAPDEVLICVDGSTDDTGSVVAGLKPPYAVLRHQGDVNRGRAATRNLGLAKARGTVVLLLDSDMELTATAIEHHLRTTGSGWVSVGAIRYDNASENPWAGYLMTRGRNRYDPGAELPFTQFTTANAMVPAQHLRVADGFDESFAGYGGEDLDFAWRLHRRAGAKFVNSVEAVAHTTEPKTWPEAMIQFEEYGAGNLQLLMARHPDAPLTFELWRRERRTLRDRLFMALLHHRVEALAKALVPVAPSTVRNHLFSYLTVAAVHRGYVRARP